MLLELTCKNETKVLISIDLIEIVQPMQNGVMVFTKNDAFALKESYEFVKTALDAQIINTKDIKQ